MVSRGPARGDSPAHALELALCLALGEGDSGPSGQG